ncbi:GmrSD restriction endonuclease domain-containing protein [Nocardia sp. IBHARD005]|uniref:GmrSD restriction endonuclease domain-containing protein n=1 Tax=Nocardia sp. IBHARD005 TaxID=3457765 RepID=UPI004058CC1F
MALDSPKLQDVLKQIHSGVMQLPEFQRNWKWDDQRIRELIATVTLNYPLGVVMALETGGEAQFRARPLAGVQVEGLPEPSALLLDGQQRLTSLYQALYLDRPVETVDDRGRELTRWYFMHVGRAIGSPADRDEAIVSVPEDYRVPSANGRGVALDLTTIANQCAAGYFPLNIIFDGKRLSRWRSAFEKADSANEDLWAEFEERVVDNIKSFLIPMIRLDATTSAVAVCSVFERVNTGGVPLTIFELLTATYAGNQAFEEANRDYYKLPDAWTDIKKGLATAHPVFGNIDLSIENGLTSSDFLQAVALVRTWELKQHRPSTAISCKRRDLLALPLQDFIDLSPRLRDAFDWVGHFLSDQCIVSFTDLPYRSQLVPLAAVRAILGEDANEPAILALIIRWYWCGVLGEMYGGSTESRFTRDVEQLVAWRDDRSGVPDTIAEASFVADRLDKLSTRNSAAYKGVIALLIKQGAHDWYYTEDPLTAATLGQYAVDIRQIFPKQAQVRLGIPLAMANSIINKTPLSERASRSMNTQPSNYLRVLAAEAGRRRSWYDDVVRTHLIDPAALHRDAFDRFYNDRKQQLLKLVQSAMGKTTLAYEEQGASPR